MSTNPAVVNTGNDALPSSYPDLDATSPTDSVIAGDFGQMSSADQVSNTNNDKYHINHTFQHRDGHYLLNRIIYFSGTTKR